MKFTTLQKDKEDAGKAEANNWNIKFANYKKEAEAEKAAAVKAEADKITNQWNIKWGDYQKKAEADKEAAVKAEANQWNIKFGNYKKEADAAANEKLAAEKNQWNLKFTTLQKEKDAAVSGNNDEAKKYKTRISDLEKDMKHLTTDYETKLKSWNLKWTKLEGNYNKAKDCLLYTSPSPRDATLSRMPSSA